MQCPRPVAFLRLSVVKLSSSLAIRVSVQVGRCSAALLELLTAAAGARLVAAYLRLKRPGHRPFVNGPAQGKPVGVHAQDGLGDLQRQFGPLCRRARECVLFGSEVVFSQQSDACPARTG